MLPYFMKIYLLFLCWNWLSSETSTITGNIYDLHLYYLTLVKKWPLTFTASLHILIAYTVIKCSCFGISSPNDNKLAQKKYIFKGF